MIGSVFASVYGSRLTGTTPAGVPGQVAALAHHSVGAAYAAAGALTGAGHPALGQALHLASTNAFLRGLTIGALWPAVSRRPARSWRHCSCPRSRVSRPSPASRAVSAAW